MHRQCDQGRERTCTRVKDGLFTCVDVPNRVVVVQLTNPSSLALQLTNENHPFLCESSVTAIHHDCTLRSSTVSVGSLRLLLRMLIDLSELLSALEMSAVPHSSTHNTRASDISICLPYSTSSAQYQNTLINTGQTPQDACSLRHQPSYTLLGHTCGLDHNDQRRRKPKHHSDVICLVVG